MSKFKRYETTDGNYVLRDDEGHEKRFRAVHNEDGSTTYIEDPDMSYRLEKNPFEGTIPEDWETHKKRDPVDAQFGAFVMLIFSCVITFGIVVILSYFIRDTAVRLGLVIGAVIIGGPLIYKQFKELREISKDANEVTRKNRENAKKKK